MSAEAKDLARLRQLARAAADTFEARGVMGDITPVALLLLSALLIVACGGSTDSTTCPHRTHQVAGRDGSVTVVDNTREEDQEVCDYLAYQNTHVHDGVVDCDGRQGVTGAECGEAGAGGAQ